MADAAASDIVDRLVAFGHALRDEGLPVGSDDVLAFCSAVATLNPGDQEDVFWSGRATLVHRREHLPLYDEIFRQFFLGIRPPRRDEPILEKPVPVGSSGTLNIPDSEPGDQP
ncbi:MAG: hypothetical protein AAF480_09625, partial [Actinomycetota bacterium]